MLYSFPKENRFAKRNQLL